MLLRRVVILVLLVAALPFATLAQPRPSLDDVTVIQTDGWQHRHVTAALLDDGASLRITRTDGASLVLPLSSVREIRDDEGHIVTHELIPGVAPPPPAADPGPPAPAATPPPARPPRPEPPFPFHVTLGGGLGWGYPSGDYYDGVDDGRLIVADVRLALGPRHYLKFCYRVHEVFDGPLGYVDRDGGYVTGVAPAEAEIRSYLLSIGFLSGATQGNLLRAYLEVGGGMGDHVLTYTDGPVAGSEREDRLLGILQGGLLIPFGGAPVGLDLAASATFKISGGESGEGGGIVTAVQAGVVLLLGREP
jgi:hypothetical protein